MMGLMRPAIVLFGLSLSLYAQDIVLPDGKAKTLIQNTCTECHGLDMVVSSNMSPDEWKTTLDQMIKRGATLNKDEREVVLEYLTVYFSAEKLNVNTATAEQLKSGLQLTDAEAEAVIAARKSAKIKDLEAFRKVKDVDPKKIEAKKGQLTF
jgi:hypothetical protein